MGYSEIRKLFSWVLGSAIRQAIISVWRGLLYGLSWLIRQELHEFICITRHWNELLYRLTGLIALVAVNNWPLCLVPFEVRVVNLSE